MILPEIKLGGLGEGALPKKKAGKESRIFHHVQDYVSAPIQDYLTEVDEGAAVRCTKCIGRDCVQTKAPGVCGDN